MDNLVEMGKTTMDVCCKEGQFFFPKILLCRIEAESLEMGQYESGIEDLRALLKVMALSGPIDWIAHTADSYQFLADPDNEEDLAMAERVSMGEFTVSELYEAGDPRAIEALGVNTLSRFGFAEMAVVPYTRVGGHLVWAEVQQANQGVEGRITDALREGIALSLQVSA